MFGKTVLASTALLCTVCRAAPAPQAASDPSRFTFYDLKTPLAGPCDMTTGPDGAIWVDTFLSNKIVRIDENTGDLEEYSIPYTLGPLPNSVIPSGPQGRVALACVIQPGKDGNLYAATGVRNQFVKINPTTKNITVFNTSPPNPLGNLQPFNDAWPGDKGMYFSQTTGNVISLFDYQTEKITNYPVPTPLAGPLGMIIGSDGALWFTEFFADKIGRLDTETGHITEYPVPLTGFGPAVMRAETEGRYLWFTALIANGIGRIDEKTGEVKIFTNPSPLSFPTEDTVDGEGNIWFSTLSQNTLNYLTPSTGKFTSIAQPDGTIIPAPVSIPPVVDIAMHYKVDSNTMWFTELAANRVGKYKL